MYSAPISSYTQPGAVPTTQGTPQRPGGVQEPPKEPYPGLKPSQMPGFRPEEKKVPMMPPLVPSPAKMGTEGPRAGPPPSTVPIQLAKDFLSIVKKGNMSEIVSFISMPIMA